MDIRVFIASSSEVKNERNVLREHLQSFNNRFDEYDIRIVPIMWELESKKFDPHLKRKQETFNKRLATCDVVFFLIGTRIGDYTQEEFDYACSLAKEGGKLKILIYFKNIPLSTDQLTKDDASLLGEVKQLQHHISEELGQAYGTYNDISEIISAVYLEAMDVLLSRLSLRGTKINKLIQLYDSIILPFQQSVKETILDQAIQQLHFYITYNKDPQMNEESFYELCNEIIDNTSDGSYIKATSFMLKSEWDNSEDEQNFWNANVNAVKRGVQLERIFILNKNEAHRLKTNHLIREHISLQEANPLLRSYALEFESLKQLDQHIQKSLGKGFLSIENAMDAIAFLDEDPNTGQQRATAIIDEQHLCELSIAFNEIKKITLPLKEYLDSISWSHYKKEMVSIFVTTECNLNCGYCFTNKEHTQHENQTISLEFAKRGISDYFASGMMRHVRFFGAGEPTIKFKLLKEIYDYSRCIGGPATTFEIQTNGAFNDNVAEWLSNKIDIIWISCDGTPDIQDKHRPCLDGRKSSTLIEKNIRILKKGTSFVGIRATITCENLRKQSELVDYFHKLGIKDIWVDPLFPSVGESIAKEELPFDMILFAQEFLKAAEYARTKDVFYGSILTCNFNDPVDKHCRACIPVPHLTTDGYVSACDMALFGKDKNHMSELFYGQWNEQKNIIEYDECAKNMLSRRTTKNMSHCEVCSAKEQCGGYCLGEILNETGDLYGKKPNVCDAIRFLNSHMSPELRRYKYTHP